jgi:hypothetical protein
MRPPAVGRKPRRPVLTLLDRVAQTLTDASVPHALIGAAAMAVHGVSRSTFDCDLLVTDARVLHAAFWKSLPADVVSDVRRGDPDDPLAGVVRFTSPGERDVDVIIGKSAWQTEIISRAQRTRVADIPVVGQADLVLLKLYAGGLQDRWDIGQLLSLAGADAVRRAVDLRVAELPVASRDLWGELRG